MEKKENKMHLPTIDDIFTTQEERDSIGNIVNIPIQDIDNFSNHPFKVNVDDEMLESIKDNGVVTPVIVRKKENGKYEMVSGHRRKLACEKLNIKDIPCVIKDLTDDEAIIIMADSNLQREKILPSEKAFAYKMKMEALTHQGKRTDLTSCPMVTKLQSAENIGKDYGDSERQVYRFIRLTELIPKLLEMVDNEKIAFRPAVEISYLTNEEQTDLLDFMESYDCTPSLAQAIKLKNLSETKKLTVDEMEELLSQEKPNQIPKLKVSMNRLSSVLPKTLKNDKEREDYVVKAVEFYDKYQKKMKERKMQER